MCPRAEVFKSMKWAYVLYSLSTLIDVKFAEKSRNRIAEREYSVSYELV